MKKILSNIVKDLPLEIRILVFASIGGSLFAVFTGLANFFLNIGPVMILTSLVTGLISLCVLYFAIVKRQYKVPAYLGILALVLVMYPVMWINNAGSHGPMAFFMMFNALFCSLLLAYLNYRIVLVTQVLVVYGLLIFEYFNPEKIVAYQSEKVRLIDMGFSFTIVFLLTFYLVVKIMNEYNRNIKELEKVKGELLEINNKLVVVSETDELTGICNRRHIMSLLKRLILLQDAKDIALIMFDIDHFKTINDTYGHSVGDDVIKRVSNVMEENIRRSDSIGRIGGEEFLIVLPNTPLDQAYKKADQLRESIENLQWSYENLKVCVSGGVYCNALDESLDRLMEKVDEQLYLAKNAGRNRVCKPMGIS
jgi:diguanylate cyclase (GGDEF)-like protein